MSKIQRSSVLASHKSKTAISMASTVINYSAHIEVGKKQMTLEFSRMWVTKKMTWPNICISISFFLKIRLRQLSRPLLQQLPPQPVQPPPQLPQQRNQKNHPNLSEYQAIFRLSHLANPLHWNVMLNPYMIKISNTFGLRMADNSRLMTVKMFSAKVPWMETFCLLNQRWMMLAPINVKLSTPMEKSFHKLLCSELNSLGISPGVWTFWVRLLHKYWLILPLKLR